MHVTEIREKLELVRQASERGDAKMPDALLDLFALIVIDLHRIADALDHSSAKSPQ